MLQKKVLREQKTILEEQKKILNIYRTKKFWTRFKRFDPKKKGQRNFWLC